MRRLSNIVGLAGRKAGLGLGLLVGLGLSVICPRAGAAAAPPNDNFASATPISGLWGTTNGSNAGATAQAGEPAHAGFTAKNSVWFAFTPVQEGTLTVHTYGSDFNTRLAVYTFPGNTNGSVGALFPVAANGNLDLSAVHGPRLSGAGSSFVKFPVSLGTTYYIAVDGANGATGNYTLTWGYNFAGIFYLTKSPASSSSLVEVRKDEVSGSVPFYVSRAFGSAGRVQVTATDAAAVNAGNPATPGIDYVAGPHTLTFDDYETLKQSSVSIIDALPIPDPQDPFHTNSAPYNPNYYFAVQLVSAQLDSGENPKLIAPPVVITNWTTTACMIEPNVPFGSGDPMTGKVAPFTNNVINFEVTHKTTTEYNGDGDGNVHIRLTRSVYDPTGGMYGQSCTVYWGVDSTYVLGDLLNNSFDLTPESDYATPQPGSAPYGVGPSDFGPPYSGTVTWAANDTKPKEIVIPINDDTIAEFNEDFIVQFGGTPTGCTYGEVVSTIVTIQSDYHDGPAGALEWFYNDHQDPPSNPVPGANATVFALAVQPQDQSVVIGGDFTAYDAHLRNRIARINFNGYLDTSFDPGNGADGVVASIALQSDGRILMAGDFYSVGGVDRYKIARLNANGSVDLTFNPGVGADDAIWSVALGQNNGTNCVIVGGQFYSFNDYPRMHVARLDYQGNVDLSFDTSTLQLNGYVWAVAVQADGKVLIGGDFTLANGLLRSHIARLNTDGSLDTSFDPLLGANDTVYTLLVQPDGNILVGGAFTQFNTTAQRGVTRLQPSGALDPTFNPGTGADGVVYSLFYSASDATIYVGGSFASFNSTRRVGLARLFADGTVDTGFLDTAYNQFAGFTNPLLNPDRYPRNVVFAIGLEDLIVNGGEVLDPVAGGSFARVGGGSGSRRAMDTRQNLALLRGGSTIGPGNLTLTYPTYSVDENGAHLQVTLTRTNGTLGTVAARFSPDPLPVGPGAAVYGKDYTFSPKDYGLPGWGSSWGPAYRWSRMLSDGIWGQNYPNPQDVLPGVIPNFTWFNNADVTIVDNAILDGNRTFKLNLTVPWQMDTFFLGGANIPLATALGAVTSTSSTVVDDEKRLGGFTFVTTNYSFSEGVGTANILVLRTNGADLQATLHYQTYDLAPASNHARSNINYVPVSGTLTFRPTVTNQSFQVTIIPDHMATPDLSLLLVITNFNPSGVKAGVTNALLSIIDQDFPGGRLNFSSAGYTTNEMAGGAVITVTRTGSSLGTLSVVCSTTPTGSTAVAGTNYLPATTTLTWASGDSAPKTFVVPVLHDGLITGNLTVKLLLSSPTLNGLANPGTIGPVGSATLTILDLDRTGTVGFSSPTYNQNENGGYAIIPVVRQGGLAGTVTANFSASGLGSTVAGVDFVATNGTLTFGPGEVCKVFTVPLINNAFPDAARQVALTLSGVTPSSALGNPPVALLNIVDDETYDEPPGGDDTAFNPVFDGPVNALALQPDGKIVAGGNFTLVNSVTRHDVARLNSNGTVDYSFAAQPGGANNAVRCLALQSDGRMLIGGEFTNYDGAPRNYFARLNLDGTLDWQYDPGSALNGFVNAVVETFTDTNRTSRRILVGGNFTLANGTPRNYLAQFTDTGALDLDFNPNFPSTGIDGQVWAVAVQSDLKIVIGGDFQAINGVSRNHIARLNQDGSLDLSFAPGSGASDPVRALAIQLDGRIMVGGLFTNFNGTLQNHFARLNADGSLDATFNGGVGTDGAVLAIALQPDTRILLGGEFHRCSGVTRNRLTRLNPDGSVDPSINFGNGLNSFVASMVIQTNDYIVLGGGFTTYDNAPASYLARIFGRSIAGSGQFEFTSALYGADETATNAVLTVRRRGGTSGTSSGPNVSVTVSVTNGTATNGVNYLGGFFTNTFAPGETYQSLVVPVLHDNKVTADLMAACRIVDIQPLGLAQGIGNQPTASLIISNVDSGVQFASPTYAIAKNAPQGRATIPVTRFGSLRGTAQVDVTTLATGTAVPYQRYIPVTSTLVFGPGQSVQNAFVPILNDNLILGDTTVDLALANAGNTLISAPSAATLTIRETTTAPGTLALASATYSVSEQAGSVTLTVVRSSGHTGTVTVDYSTQASNSVAASTFVATNGTLAFADGETAKSIVVPILYNSAVLGNQTFTVNLSNATGGAAMGSPASAIVTVLEEDTGIMFDAASANVATYETAAQVVLNVLRPYGTNGVTQVDYATSDGSALAGTNYVAISGTLIFNPGDTLQTLTVPLKHDPRVTGDVAFDVSLSNPTGGAQLVAPSTATVRLLDVEASLSFTNSALSVLESATNAIFTVVCSNPNISGTGTVAFATVDGTGIAGRDYTPTNGVLSFWSGNLAASIAVPILDNSQVDGNRSFSINLFNATAPGQLAAPTNIAVTIIDDDAGLSFTADNYSVPKNGGKASLSIVRTGYTNSALAVNYSTEDGTALAGYDYTPITNGVVTFAAGQMSTNIQVTILGGSTNIIRPDRTLFLQLSNAVVRSSGNFHGSASLVPPSAASLTIVDTSGSLVVAAGSALVSENLPPANGTIDPGEQVTLWFAFRVAGGLNVSNLQATLLATNNVTAPSGPQLYGSLVKNGPSGSRQFSFTANGTNGQQIVPTFSLQDGTNDLGLVQFTYTLGISTSSFTNGSAIVINDFTNATPYPSVISVTNAGGSLRKVTVTLTNLSHTYPSDVDVLLVAPSGANSYLMAECGGSHVLSHATLSFDDAAASGLPASSLIASGTYRPTSYAPGGLSLGSPAPPAPYGVGLAGFNGASPLGDWKLFIIDDTANNAGAISNGWYMTLVAANPVVGKADLVTSLSAAPNPATVSSNILYSIAVTNYGPASATNVVVTNVLPASATFVPEASTPGADLTVPGYVIYRLGTLAKDAAANLTIAATATATNVTVTNWVWAFSETPEANAANNTNLVSTVVTNFAADLTMNLTVTPDPGVPNGTLTYNILVSNLGPATATNLRVTNTLPSLSAVSLLAVSPSGYVTNGSILAFTNLGNLGSGASTNLSIRVKTLTPGTLSDTASAVSSVVDPLKGNNSQTIKTLVTQPPMTVACSRNALTICWPAVADKYVLETATNLTPPVAWTQVTAPSAQLANGQYSVTMGATNGTRFFRLRAPAP